MKDSPTPDVFERIATALERIADRLDLDASQFDEMVEAGRMISAATPKELADFTRQ